MSNAFKTSEELIEEAWSNSQRTVNWLGFEHCLRQAVREYRLGDVSQCEPAAMLDHFSEIIAAYTGRGRP